MWICREDTYQQQEIKEDTNGVKTPAEKTPYSKKKPMASRIHQENTNSKKKPMVSRIRREDTEEETNGVQNLPRRITARRNQWRQESAEKKPSLGMRA